MIDKKYNLNYLYLCFPSNMNFFTTAYFDYIVQRLLQNIKMEREVTI